MRPINARMPYMVDDRHLLLALVAALMLHLCGYALWHYAPKNMVQDIPIRTLSLRLGDVDDAEADATSRDAANFSNAPAVEAIVDSVARDLVKVPEPKPTVTPKAPLLQTVPPKNELQQYVREVSAPKIPQSLRKELPTDKDAEIMSRYTQLISLWIQKFKIYPEEARLSGMEGSTVVRIRIDRKGTIRFYTLERSTGNPILDKAAIDMIRRANPVPSVPNDYPKGDLLEFLIPVSFSLL